MLRLLDPSITAAGVLRAEKILDAVRDILGEVTIDAAIRASIAIPGVITPHVFDGRLLADGGILDPLPMAPIAAVNADLTIAVSLAAVRPVSATRRPRPSQGLPRNG